MSEESRYEWCWLAFAKHLIHWKYSSDYRWAANVANRCEVYKKLIICSE
jgi:hypothetical protein